MPVVALRLARHGFSHSTSWILLATTSATGTFLEQDEGSSRRWSEYTPDRFPKTFKLKFAIFEFQRSIVGCSHCLEQSRSQSAAKCLWSVDYIVQNGFTSLTQRQNG